MTCDVACLLYDVTNPRSFNSVIRIYHVSENNERHFEMLPLYGCVTFSYFLAISVYFLAILYLRIKVRKEFEMILVINIA